MIVHIYRSRCELFAAIWSIPPLCSRHQPRTGKMPIKSFVKRICIRWPTVDSPLRCDPSFPSGIRWQLPCCLQESLCCSAPADTLLVGLAIEGLCTLCSPWSSILPTDFSPHSIWWKLNTRHLLSGRRLRLPNWEFLLLTKFIGMQYALHFTKFLLQLSWVDFIDVIESEQFEMVLRKSESS